MTFPIRFLPPCSRWLIYTLSEPSALFLFSQTCEYITSKSLFVLASLCYSPYRATKKLLKYFYSMHEKVWRLKSYSGHYRFLPINWKNDLWKYLIEYLAKYKIWLAKKNMLALVPLFLKSLAELVQDWNLSVLDISFPSANSRSTKKKVFSTIRYVKNVKNFK